jgi:hypothetical protein
VYLQQSALQPVLLSLLYEAWGVGLSYSGFVEVLAAAYGYIEPSRHYRLVSYARSLMNTLRSKAVVDPLLRLSSVPAQLRRVPGSIAVVDCLGLAELYWIFKRVRENNLSVVASVYVNEAGKTGFFKSVFGEETMLGVTRQLGGHLFTRIDEVLHARLELVPRHLDELSREMEANFKPVAEELARIAVERRIAIAADHGYDIVRQGELFVLSHGGRKGENTLSKLAPLLIIARA